jgi:uncharacterized membrane protein YkoI
VKEKMNRKIVTLALAGILALGGTVAAYAATNSKTDTVSNSASYAVTEDQAKQTALASVTGGTFKGIELEDEDGVMVYGVEIQSGTEAYDVKVDATTGAVVKSEQDKNDKEENGLKEESQNGDNDNVEHENQNEDPAGYED